MDYYKLLEVSPHATQDEIKKAYRRLAQKYHPDKNQGDKAAEAKFKELVNAYQILSDSEERKNYNSTQRQQYQTADDKQQERKTENNPGNPITQTSIFLFFTELRKKVDRIEKENINQRNLFDSINDILTDKNISYLLNCDEIITNSLIIDDVLECCKPLGYDRHPIQSFIYIEKIIPKLVKLAGSNNESIQKIYTFSKKKKKFSNWYSYKVGALIFGGILFIAILANVGNDSSSSSSNTPSNGDLNNTFTEKQLNPTASPEQKFQQQKDSLITNGWEEQKIDNGQLSSCYNFKPTKGKIANYLEIVVGGGTDVAIKIMNLKTEKCIRYVFINSGSTYRINSIPEGKYYLKIAYGKNWLSKVVNGQCIGKFILNPLYEKGEDIFDYNLKYHDDGYRIPSFRLKLDIVATDISNSFNSANISENEFNL